MKFDKLNETIPYVTGGKQKVLTMSPYPFVTLAMPGRHAKDTTPVGGDFVVMVTESNMGWDEHQFTHIDLFRDLQLKADDSPVMSNWLMESYLDVVLAGKDPEAVKTEMYKPFVGLTPSTFLATVQCLAVAEHRRYSQYEAKFGGRYLPFRFGAGIVEGLWTATDAAEKQKRGRPGVEWLEKDFGVPALTKELMN